MREVGEISVCQAFEREPPRSEGECGYVKQSLSKYGLFHIQLDLICCVVLPCFYMEF